MIKKKFTIRKAQMADVKIANSFLTKLIHDEKKYDSNINENCIISSFYENFVENEQNCILLVEDHTVIIGYLYGFVINGGDAYVDIVTQLDAMFVENNYRNLGVGNALIDEFKKWSKQQGAKYIQLKVCNKNDNAISLYKKNGFESAKTIMLLELEE